MLRILVPIVIAVGGIASGLFLNNKLREQQPVLAMVIGYGEAAFSVALAIFLYLKVLA
jgi:hypothetical protein